MSPPAALRGQAGTESMVRVLLVDDSQPFLDAASRYLEAESGLTVVGRAHDGEAALGLVERLRPDLVVMDWDMPGLSGPEATRQIKARPGSPRVVILTMHDQADYVAAARAAHADGFVSKADFSLALLPLIRQWFSGGIEPRPVHTKEKIMERQLVIFNLADEFYGVDISAVEGIIKMQAITAVPHAPPFVEGVTNLRGKVLPVLDLRKRFGINVSEKTRDSRIVTVDVAGLKVGMVVDGVSEVLRIPEESIEPPSPLVTTVDSSFITGIAKLGDRLIILLDLGKVMSVDEQSQLQGVARAT